ncbi:hypothetical protein DOE76_13945 [Leifsonia sp. ku-ls]|nr:hypothetical protein DOE76_13945 [Leifsonia sp. ku-ls]
MTAVITVTFEGDDYSFSPDLVLDYTASSTSRNVFHQILGGGQDVTLLPSEPRTGTLAMWFREEADAYQMEAIHGLPLLFTLSDDEYFSIGMQYAVDGRVTRTRNDDGTWSVAVDYREVQHS